MSDRRGLMKHWVRSEQQRLRRWPPGKWFRSGTFRQLTPISRVFGLDRGQCIDRFYIERFLSVHARDIRGAVLEIGDDGYAVKFGRDRVTRCDVLHVEAGHAGTTVVADLTHADGMASDAFDCIIFTQTLQLVYDVRAVVGTLHRLLKSGGVLLATVPGISQISRFDMDRWGEYWRFTTLSTRRLLEEVFPSENVSVEAYGNVLTAVAFLDGLAAEELRADELDYHDADYELADHGQGDQVRVVTIVGTSLLGLLWLLAFAVAGAAGLEFLLRIRSDWHPPAAQTDSSPKYDRLERAYEPFGVLHLHPQYLFFFPRDPRERVAMSNETCSIDADGFRGPGPARAGGRRLAFLLGGSAAFGMYASSDATTITGYLNRLQDEYFFVNAGVSDWNSTQELFRVAFQILDYRPALVVTYDGVNDAALLAQNSQGPVHYPVGTPDSFADLAALIDERASASAGRALASLVKALFPELNERIDARFGRVAHSSGAAPVDSATLPESVLQEGAARYLANLALIRDLTTARGARFITVFQPVAHLHRHLGPGLPSETFAIDGFHRTVMARYRHDFAFHDLADVFDQYYATIPVMNPDITDATIFVDEVHLYDPGNEIVARELSRLIR